MVKAILIEDELNVREGFIKLMKVFCPEVNVVAVAETVEEGLGLVQGFDFDILFLDINLPDGSGFDLLHRIPDRKFATIFVTAYDQYAIDAFKISAVDYLLKPVSPDRLKQAVDKAKTQLADNISPDSLQVLQDRLAKKFEQTEKIILRDAERLQIVIIGEIIYCEANGAYTKFHLSERRSIMTSINLKEYERMLAPYDFARCHHSYLINLHHVTEVVKTDGGSVRLTGDAQLPLSTRKRPVIIDALKGRFVS
ncbi:MAG: LytTR family DNA-binding domain-containing protein [Bacteroidota bacterium]